MRQFGRILEEAGPRDVELRGQEVHLLRDSLKPTGEVLAPGAVTWTTPVRPTKILGIGRNYRAHAKEMGGEVPREPLFYLKPPSSLLAHGQSVILPRASKHVDYEAELGVVIGTRARKVKLEHALDYVSGYTIVCDVTARDLQKRDEQWTRAKGFDTFCPIAPLVTQGVDARALDIELRLNGELQQSGNTRDMAFGVPELIAYLSQVMTLEPGDLIATGTPEGVGPLSAGDRVDITISQLGELSFGVSAEGD